jgi:hypothetical protein
MDSAHIMPKPDHISDLERRQKALEEEITETLRHCSTDDSLIADLKRRGLVLRDELERLRHNEFAVRRGSLH